MNSKPTPQGEATKASLQPGVYRKQGRVRTLLQVDGVKCVYVFGEADKAAGDQTAGLPATTCSLQTFMRAVGKTPERTLEADKLQELRKRMTCMVPYRRANRYERRIFFDNRAAAISDEAQKPTENSQTAQEKATKHTASLLARLAAGVKGAISRVLSVFNHKPQVAEARVQTVEGGAQ